MRAVQAHQGTTAHVAALYPWMAEPGLGAAGVPIGFDYFSRQTFVFDPFELYQAGVLTNPNMVVAGMVGKAKSSLVKTLALRWLYGAGRQVVVIDPKGEYAALAEALGVRPVRLGADSGVRLNPLDAVVSGTRQVGLLRAILGARLRRALTEQESLGVVLGQRAAAAVAAALGRSPELGDVLSAMQRPDPASLAPLGIDPAEFRTATQSMCLALWELLEDRVGATLNGQTSPDLDLSGKLVVFDLRSERETRDLGVLMACVAGWLGGAAERGDTMQRMLVFDEAWKAIEDPRIALWLRGSTKLAREGAGIAHIYLVHGFRDFSVAGDAGSEQQAAAQGLLADVETVVAYALPPADAEAVRDARGLSRCETETIPTMRRGTALWRVGNRSFLVAHRLASELEEAIVQNGMEQG